MITSNLQVRLRVNQVLKTDDQFVDAHQVIYDYLWDRWGLRVGTFRSGFIVLFWCVEGIRHFRSEGFNLGALLSYALLSVLVMWMYWFFFFKAHAGENQLQSNGSFDTLNRAAMEWQGTTGFRRRLFICGFMTIVAYLFGTVWDPLVWVQILTFTCWAYARAVLVRDRDAGRFEERKLAWQV